MNNCSPGAKDYIKVKSGHDLEVELGVLVSDGDSMIVRVPHSTHYCVLILIVQQHRTEEGFRSRFTSRGTAGPQWVSGQGSCSGSVALVGCAEW